MIIPSIGVALGAKVLEKHFTLDRKMTGSGHFFSVNPDDLSSMIYNVRLTELVQGNHEFRVEEVEQAARNNARRSLVASQAISKGTSITSNMVGVKRSRWFLQIGLMR